MEKYVECQNCQEQYDCERTYLGGCTDGKEWEEKPLLSKSDKEFYFTLMTNCKKVIEKCPNIEERRLACEYCRFEQVRKKAVEEYERKLSDGELVSKDWHDEQVLHAENEIEELKKDYIELDLECRNLRTELDKELAEHEEFVKRANGEIESLKSKSSFKNSWKNKFFKAQEEVEWYKRAVEGLTSVTEVLDKENTELQKQVDELKAEKETLYIEMSGGQIVKMQLGPWAEMSEIIKKQAVKDTAREILLLSKDTPTYWDFVQAVKERYGVEVE